MVKKFSAILIAFCVVCTMFAGISVSAETKFECTYSVDYDNSIIHYEVTTPARYRQIITATLSNGDSPSDVVRVDEVHADIKGKATGSIQMTSSDSSGTYVLKTSGAGYLGSVSDDSDEVYFESYENIYGAGGTLDRFNDSTVDTVGELFEEKKAMFDYNFEDGSDYAENSDVIHDMFVAIREEDYEGAFENFAEVQNAITAISAIREITFATSSETAQTLCEKSAALMGIDKEHEDYKNNETAIYNVLLSLFNEKAPETITEIRKYIQQSIGIAKLNRVDALEATDVVRTYGEVLGIDVAEYETYIRKYDKTRFNYAFVGMNFTTATEVVASYNERKANPPAKAEKPSSGGGGGGGGGGGSDRKDDDSWPKTPYDSIEVGESINVPVKENISSLTDIDKEHWAYEPVKVLFDTKVISGYPDGSFRPENSVTREQFVKMLVMAFEMKGDTDINYTDVPKNAWYYETVKIATANNITKGYGKSFGVGANITREDAAVMIYRIMEESAETAEEIKLFDDDESISSYAKDAVYGLSDIGVINGMGDGNFAPRANLTRAQAAKIICTALQHKLLK